MPVRLPKALGHISVIQYCLLRYGKHKYEGPPGHDPACKRCGVLKSRVEKVRKWQEEQIAQSIQDQVDNGGN